MTTLCSTCDHVTADTRGKPPRYWECIKHPDLPGSEFPFIDPEWRDNAYKLCRGINGGACPLWKARRDNQTELL